MELIKSTWIEIAEYLKVSDGIIIPTGSVEQHGPMGLIGTDMICADEIASLVAEKSNALITPPITYAPAEFNMGFPGTISLSVKVYRSLCSDVFKSLERHGFRHIYIINGHGANLDPLNQATKHLKVANCRIKSWWDFKTVNTLRDKYFGNWEGMHATPAEISITQVNNRTIVSSLADIEPEQLSKKYIKEHSGDKHGGATEHREAFPDGRVGSHSALARREYGIELMNAAISEIRKDYLKFLKT